MPVNNHGDFLVSLLHIKHFYIKPQQKLSFLKALNNVVAGGMLRK